MAEVRPTVLVTGGSRGIDAAVVIAAAATYDVVLNHTGSGDAHTVDEVAAAARERGARVMVHAADVSDEGAVVAMFRRIDDEMGTLGGAHEWVHYAATKGAIDTMTVGLARELATAGVRVNGVRPGLITSDFHHHAPAGRLERMAPAIPMQAAGTPAEVAAAVVWLLGAEASYVTGTCIDVSGGR